MSRDWTPRQLHEVDLQVHMSQNVITITVDGVESVFVDPHCETAKKYPNLYFLCKEILDKLQISKSEVFVKRVEDGLTAIIDLFDKGMLTSGSDLNEGTYAMLQGQNEIKLLRLICMWYDGKLDESFYYNTYNNELFLEGLMEMEEDNARN